MGAKVVEIRKSAEGARVEYIKKGERFSLEGDACICTLPLPILKDIENDLSTAKQRAMADISYVPTGKMGLQFKRRFWEEDDAIYGGISRTNMAINQIWYPSTDYLGKKGIVVGYYHFGLDAQRVGCMNDVQRLELALSEGEKIHPQYRENFESAYSVSWDQDPFSKGGFVHYSGEQREHAYGQLLQNDGHIYLAGEHMSYLNGWMAGAFESAWATIEIIHEREMASP